jgi:hypothetical protein
MTSATALTVIAISVAILAVIAILSIIFLMRLVLHLMAFEELVIEELNDLKQLTTELRTATERVNHTLRDVGNAARRMGGVLGAVASFFLARSIRPSENRAQRPLWLDGLTLGWKSWNFLRKRRQRRQVKSKTPAPRNSSLPS